MRTYKVTISDEHNTVQRITDAVDAKEAVEICLSDFDYGNYSAEVRFWSVPASRCGSKTAQDSCRFGDIKNGISYLGKTTITGTRFELD